MDYTDHQKIKDYCMEALDITEQFGLSEGLSFLIGEKFYQVHKNLRKAQNQTRFIYEQEKNIGENDPLVLGGESFKLNYALTVSENYRLRLARIRLLEKTQKQFVQEIKDFFDVRDIQEYLNSYPRMGTKQKSTHAEFQIQEEAPPMTSKDIFSEVEDILIAESMKKLFT